MNRTRMLKIKNMFIKQDINDIYENSFFKHRFYF